MEQQCTGGTPRLEEHDIYFGLQHMADTFYVGYCRYTYIITFSYQYLTVGRS